MSVADTAANSMRPPLQSLTQALAIAIVACSSVAPKHADLGPLETRTSSALPPAETRATALTSATPAETPSPPPRGAEAVEADDSCAALEAAHAGIGLEAAHAGIGGDGPEQGSPVGDQRASRSSKEDEARYSLRGYTSRTLRLERGGDVPSAHCVLVAWPSGNQNTAGQRVNVASRIRESWFRLIENTLARIPQHHANLVRRLVIDDRPTEHGIAPFDRQSPSDARDGRTIWLHEHLFTDPNHWARGNHGSYWSYHVNEDGLTAHQAPDRHDLFSPVLLHEIGHLVMYHLVNATARGIQATAAPSCAHTCGETSSCATLAPLERERNCISPYCMPFRFPASTENWAEQYRFYFQSARTRELLSQAKSSCLSLLHEHDHGIAPWLSGKPDIADFRPSRWASCGEKPCKGW